jgi:dCMP deaminase
MLDVAAEFLKWDRRFMNVAKEVSTWSKDPSTQVGAVCIDPRRQIVSMGYNGFPRLIEDTPRRLNDRETKYKYVVHAEQNCIYNATWTGVSLAGTTMYIYGLPLCSECVKGVLQAGIQCVVMSWTDAPGQDKWSSSFELTKDMLKEAGIRFARLYL